MYHTPYHTPETPKISGLGVRLTTPLGFSNDEAWGTHPPIILHKHGTKRNFKKTYFSMLNTSKCAINTLSSTQHKKMSYAKIEMTEN